MSYEIESKSDLLTGATLIVRIPEEELDKKALYTIEHDKPEFILPFRSRYVDGQVEFVYQAQTSCKLRHLAGERLPNQYAQLWIDVFRPLLECGDWFMNPYSFVLSAEHLYYDKTDGTVSYIYVPSIRELSGYTELKGLASDLSKLILVSDAELENKVLRIIMEDFNPVDLLRILKARISLSAPYAESWRPMVQPGVAPHWPAQASVDIPGATFAPVVPGSTPTPEPPASFWAAPAPTNGQRAPAAVATPYFAPPSQPQYKQAGGYATPQLTAAPIGTNANRPQMPTTPPGDGVEFDSKAAYQGDIIINIPEDGKPVKKQKQKEKAKGKDDKRRIMEKELKKTRSVGGFRSKKQEGAQKTFEGYAAAPRVDYIPAQNPVSQCAPPVDPIDITQRIPSEPSGVCLRLIGGVHLPQIISIGITEGEIFTVGRFDASIGKKQSSFEFEKKTKAVSRRHAVIERHEDGYNIIDLSSSAGTFLNGDKLPPNTPRKLSHGCRVSFGNAGADYVWESA
ncbi:MAG: FHA domain-containing protein [Oscillospiraceae bacterium]|nr:FHA domain-containing protein [Oscillospiraceae bacterium]